MAEEGSGGAITVRDVPAAKFIQAFADSLKNNDKFVVPKWVDLVKTGVNKELAPYDPDWYYIRAGCLSKTICSMNLTVEISTLQLLLREKYT